MYFMTFFPNGDYCFQVAEMTTPCRWGLDEVDLLVLIHSPDPLGLGSEFLKCEVSE